MEKQEPRLEPWKGETEEPDPQPWMWDYVAPEVIERLKKYFENSEYSPVGKVPGGEEPKPILPLENDVFTLHLISWMTQQLSSDEAAQSINQGLAQQMTQLSGHLGRQNPDDSGVSSRSLSPAAISAFKRSIDLWLKIHGGDPPPQEVIRQSIRKEIFAR